MFNILIRKIRLLSKIILQHGWQGIDNQIIKFGQGIEYNKRNMFFQNIFPTTSCAWFFKKMFILLYSINWSNFIAWFPLLLEILVNVRIAIVCFPSYDVINFGINRIFLIKPFFYLTKKSKSRQNFKYLENESGF